MYIRNESRINTDWFPKPGAEGAPRACTPGIFLDINSPKFPFPGFMIYWGGIKCSEIGKRKHCPWDHFPDFNLESSIIILKRCLLWKIWPISIKRWKPVWIHACTCSCTNWTKTNATKDKIEPQCTLYTTDSFFLATNIQYGHFWLCTY